MTVHASCPSRENSCAASGGEILEFPDIRPRGEGLFSRAGQNDHPDGGIAAERRERRYDLAEGCSVERVQGIRPVDRDPGDRSAVVDN